MIAQVGPIGRIAWRRFVGSGLALFVLTAGAFGQNPPPTVSDVLEARQVDLIDEVSQGRPGYTVWETITQSIFPKHAPKREWTPLYASTFLTEGWLEPHIAPPNGSGGSLRQGWIGVPDAFFDRQIVGLYNYTRGKNGNPNEQAGAFIIESPISRRWDVGFVVPFIDNLQGNGVTSATSFGDVTIVNRFMLHETQDLTVSLNFNV